MAYFVGGESMLIRGGVRIHCRFQTYTLYRWHDVPANAIRIADLFHPSILNECRNDHFAVNDLRLVVEASSISLPKDFTDEVIDSALKVLKSGAWVLTKEGVNAPTLAIPSGVSVDANIKEASAAKFHMKGSAWFYNKVRNGGEWDYKQRGRRGFRVYRGHLVANGGVGAGSSRDIEPGMGRSAKHAGGLFWGWGTRSVRG